MNQLCTGPNLNKKREELKENNDFRWSHTHSESAISAKFITQLGRAVD